MSTVGKLKAKGDLINHLYLVKKGNKEMGGWSKF